MTTTVLQENLSKGLHVVSRFVKPRTTLPVLANVLLEASNGRLKLSATDLDSGVVTYVGAKGEEEWAVTVPARTLIDLVNTLPPEPIDLTFIPKAQTLYVEYKGFWSEVKGIDAQEFPPFPHSPETLVNFPAETLKEMVSRVAFSAATDESRPILTGVRVEVNDGNLTMYAADGFRLALQKGIVADVDKFEALVPASTLNELVKLLSGYDESVSIGKIDNRILFQFGETTVYSSLIDGNYPDVYQIIPQTTKTKITLSLHEFRNAVKAANVFAREVANTLRLNIGNKKVIVSATSTETGQNTTEVGAEVNGEGLSVGLNSKYLLDVLGVLDGEKVSLGFNDPTSPVLIQDETGLWVIMPLHLSR